MKSRPYEESDGPKKADKAGHFRSNESDGFSGRLSELISDEPRASFAKRCGLNESTLRTYLSGADPSRLRLLAIADAAGVSIEWLATGNGPRKRPISVEAPSESAAKLYKSPMKQALLDEVIKAVTEGISSAGSVSPAQFMELVAVAYPLAESGATHDQLVQLTKAATAR